ncbi:MAG: AraC family transcriptional regulator [Anaeromyxobacteraceae bacterium]
MARDGSIAEKARQAGYLLELLDRVPDVVVFVKDAAGRYAAVNETLVRRLGLTHRREALGRTAAELFPAPLGEAYLAQDLAVLRGGAPIADLLELHLYPNRAEGFCLTSKVCLRDEGGEVIGLAGISRDVHEPGPPRSGSALDREGTLPGLARAVRELQERFDRPLRVERLAALAGLSPWRFSQRIRRLFGLTPAQLLKKRRLEAACALLRGGDRPVAEIALACGYGDQSAFTRQFKAVVGLSPVRYRERARG